MMKNEKGFTLVEMMIVMLVISVLLIVTIPNVAKHNTNINTKGCEAYVNIMDTMNRLKNRLYTKGFLGQAMLGRMFICHAIR
ncbi:prepilin-type N-terminal cleavage/methylation domain-containing protein [Neobacillus niacini]|nr:prepilin-type N-terminal cleavage/methylation domain-containing protein [Neobacillus niacini]